MKAAAHRVLIIDDDAWLASHMARQLEKSGYETSIASNVLEGMDVIDTFRPSLVLLDIFMPGPNGVVLLHEIRSHSDLAHIPIVICSNSAADIPASSLQSYGVRTVIDKTTMLPDDIIAAVRRELV